MSRESYEVSQQAVYDEWSIFDTCKHGLYPGEDDCTMPAMMEYLDGK